MRFKKAILGVAIGSAVLTAWAAGPESGPGMFGMFGMGREGRGGPGRAGAVEHSPERAAARVERMAQRLVRAVDGSPEQKEKISAIAKAAAQDLGELRKQGGDLRRQGMELLKAPTVDRAAIEALRSRQIEVADALSKRLSAALADTAEVLTPEQRVKLAERMQSHHGRRG